MNPMEVLVIDREALTNQLLISKLAAKGHNVVAEANKNIAFDMIKTGSFDCVMVDPAPLSEARPVIIGLSKNIKTEIKPYLMLLSKTATTEDAIKAGTNDVLNKPLSAHDLEIKMQNAQRFRDIGAHLAHEDNVHSAAGIIGKAAFNQLFLSAIDRASRYGERSYVVFLSITNREEIIAAVGEEACEKTLKKLSDKMTFIRRQSDVIGRLGQDDFAVLLQRPMTETEPMDTLNRFAEMLDQFYRTIVDPVESPRLHLMLVELPQGANHCEKYVPLSAVAVAEG